jgi:hypothetical protein
MDTTNGVDSEMAARAGIPPEIQHKKYARELRLDLEQRGLDDLRIILHQHGIPLWQEMPDDDHVRAVRKIKNRMDAWKNGRSIECDKNMNVYVNDSFNRPRNEKRCPHFVIYGPDRLIGQEIRTGNGKGMNPHVIIQFSWGNNNIAEEACAVDDMMNFAGIGESIHLGRPNVAYLIKALRRRGMMSRKSPLYGFDVFQVEQDQTTPEEPTMKYRCGVVQEDTVIHLTPASMGLAVDEEESFTIKMSDIRTTLECLDIEFVPAAWGDTKYVLR